MTFAASVTVVAARCFRDATYYIHLESLNTLLILLGCQMYSTKPAHQLVVYRCGTEEPAPLPETLINEHLEVPIHKIVI